MAMANGAWKWLVIGSVGLMWQTARAQDPSADPQVTRDNLEAARLSAETALLNAQTANMKAKYGEATTAPEGSISGLDKFGALAQWTHSDVLESLGASTITRLCTALKSACSGSSIYITSVADTRPGRVVAKSVEQQLKNMTLALSNDASAPSAESIVSTTAMIRGAVGALDSLVGLFRSDYSIADISTPADELALRIKIAEGLAANGRSWSDIQIDGLNRASESELPLMQAYRKFDTARKAAIERNKQEKDEKKKADLAATIASAEAFDKVITAVPSSPGGQSPLVAAAIALESPPASSCVLFATYNISTSTITRKRLLSRNDRITTASGGQLKLALFSSSGALQIATLAPLKQRASHDLKVLEDPSKPVNP